MIIHSNTLYKQLTNLSEASSSPEALFEASEPF